MTFLDKLQLKSKLLILGVLPAALLAILLALYFTNSRINDVYQLFEEKNKNFAVAIAKSSVYGVFSGDKESLNTLINSITTEADIHSIKITDSRGVILASTLKNVRDIPFKDLISINEDINIDPIATSDGLDELLVGGNKTSDIIGKVTIMASRMGIKQRQQEILLNSIYLTLFSLCLIGYIAYKIGLAIAKPIHRLSDDVRRIKQGHYDLPPIQHNNDDEISTLANGIHAMAQEIDGHQRNLESEINHATQELRRQNEQLNSAQQQIVKSAEAKTRFISHISHEIRTPLNGIIGFLELLKSSSHSKEQEKLINGSLISSKNLHQIINEVLDLSQLQAGKVKISKVDFHLQNTINDSLAILSSQAESNGVTLEYIHDHDTPEFIHQDPIKFGQILINLVGNAIKFSPNSTVTISLKNNKPKQNHIELCVTDKGIGISASDTQELFKEFTQLDNSLSEQGTGLGLVITQLILDALQGSIYVESTLGKGSKFCFSLPYTDTKESYSPLSEVPIEAHAFADLSSLSVLVADDNEINRLLLSNLLERQNANVICVNDGQQAIDKSTTERFDILLFDLRMPNKTGDQALHAIRMQPNNPNYKTPAIAITAHITTGLERADHINAFDGYLEKPIDQIKFYKLIEQLLSEHDFDVNPFLAEHNEDGVGHQNSVFDDEISRKSMNADTQFILHILNKFFAELPEQLNSISHDVKQNELKNAAETAHKVHGSAAYCGTPLLKNASKQLETNLRNNKIVLIEESMGKFQNEVEKLLLLKDDIIRHIKKTP
ncbi:MAG: hybrid sensor histidine kinase/response regulator [Cycloclasticus sp.]|nr:MAG: hybrid sensor histidine kinase/response regulator [Cycloclasticus sp.]